MSEGNTQPEINKEPTNIQEDLVILSQVNNEVLEVNPNVFMPLKLEKGKPSPLGVFAEAMLREKSDMPLDGKVVGEFLPGHNRTMLIGRAFFQDAEGRVYRDIDIKGSGLVIDRGFAHKKQAPQVFTPGKSSVMGKDKHDAGLLDRDDAFKDYSTAEKLLKMGIRTYRGLAIIKLKELIVNGSRRPILDLKKCGLIDEDFNPVIEVRAFGTKARIDDRRNPQLLEDAKKLIAKELGINVNSDDDYFSWFAEELGKNVGLLHKNGLSHNFLGTGHNITLDCRIVDLDSVRPLTSERHRQKEVGQVAFLVSKLSSGPKRHISEYMYEPLARLFYKGYNRTFPVRNRKVNQGLSSLNL